MYNYKFENGHCVIDIDGDNWFLDTGSPQTFAFDNNITNITIDGKAYKLGNNPGYIRDAVEKAIGIRIKGIIGGDVLGKTSFSIYKNNQMEFNANPSISNNPINVQIYCNAIIGNVTIEGEEINTLFDSGAAINYLKPNACNYCIRGEALKDVDMSGRLIVSNYCETISILGNKDIKLSFGVPIDINCGPMKVMRQCNCKAVIGLYNYGFNDTIFSEYFIVDYKNNKIYVK